MKQGARSVLNTPFKALQAHISGFGSHLWFRLSSTPSFSYSYEETSLPTKLNGGGRIFIYIHDVVSDYLEGTRLEVPVTWTEVQPKRHLLCFCEWEWLTQSSSLNISSLKSSYPLAYIGIILGLSVVRWTDFFLRSRQGGLKEEQIIPLPATFLAHIIFALSGVVNVTLLIKTRPGLMVMGWNERCEHLNWRRH